MLTSETAIDMTEDSWVINEEYEKLFVLRTSSVYCGSAPNNI